MLGQKFKIGGVAIALALWLGGCASPVMQREAMSTRFEGDQGRAGELLFASADAAPGQEQWRADGRLNLRPAEPLLASAMWPEPERASIEYTRRVFIRDREDQFTFFTTRPWAGERRGRTWHGGWSD